MINKTIHRKRKIEQHEYLKKQPRVNSGVPEGVALPAPLVTQTDDVFPSNIESRQNNRKLQGLTKTTYNMTLYFQIGKQDQIKGKWEDMP